MIFRERALTLGGRRDGNLQHFGDGANLVGCIRENRAVPRKNGRPASAEEVQRGLLDGRPIVGPTGLHGRGHPRWPLDLLLLHVGRKTEVNGARTAPDGHAQRLLPDRRQTVGSEDKNAVSRDLLEDVDDVYAFAARLLHRPPSERLRRYLSSENDDGNRVRIGGRNSGDEIRGARAGRRHARPQPTARPRIAVGHERGTGLVLRHHDLGLAPHGSREEGKHGAADHPEDVPDARTREGLDKVLGRSTLCPGPPRLPIRASLGVRSYLHRRVTQPVFLVVREQDGLNPDRRAIATPKSGPPDATSGRPPKSPSDTFFRAVPYPPGSP